jgi:hypothetical protein
MSFVLASADFSCCNSDDRSKIYARLTDENWKKLFEDSDNTHTVWVSSILPGLEKDEATELTKKKFYACCKTNCLPRVVFEWGYVDNPEPAMIKNLNRYPEVQKI